MLARVLKIKELLKKFNADSCLILNNEDIFYLSGLVSSNIALLITNEENFVFSDNRYQFIVDKQNIFTPVMGGNAFNSALYKIEELDLSSTIIDIKDLSLRDYRKIKDANKFIEKECFLNDFRIIKSDYEISQIKEAQKIAERAFLEVLNHIKGKTEREIAAKLDYLMACYGSEKPAFDTIIAFGSNSASCHAVPSDKIVENGSFLLFDFGATYKGYKCDITRTVSIGEPTNEMKNVYDIVLNAHNIAASKLKPNISGKDADSFARDYIKSMGFENEFLHSLGHGVGLDIHENPALNKISNEILLPNMVVTIEPGIYIENSFGVRIEDTYYITDSGADSLCDLKKELIIL